MINLHNRDCMDAMSEMPDNYYDLAIVDPPYGIDVCKQRIGSERKTKKWRNPKKYDYKVFNDSSIPSNEYFKELFRVSKNQIIWGGNYFTKYLDPSSGWVIWNKKVNIKEHLSMAEMAWTSFDKKVNMFDYLWAGFKKKKQIKRIHPTQKPVELYEWLLMNYAKEGDKILDTHLGSGIIAIACHKLGYSLDGYEIDTEYYNSACKRLKQHAAQLTMF